MQVVNNKKSIEIQFDEKTWKIIDKKLYSKHLGKIRAYKDKKSLSDLFSVLDPQVAFSYVCKLLAMKGQFENELRKKLKERWFDDLVIEAVFARCRTLGFLNDEREAGLYIKREKRLGKGPRTIERRLMEKSGGTQTLNEAFSEEEQREAIRELIERRFPDLSLLKTKQRAFRFLQRRGFSEYLIRELIFSGSEPHCW